MDSINGKIIISTDWHFGLKNNAVSRLSICANMIKEHIAAIKKHDIKAIIMGGDVFHERASVNVNTINVALKCIQALASKCKVYLICGNHDCFLKNSTEINSLNMFRDTPNVKIVDTAEQIIINGKSCLMVPWLTDMTKYEKESYDMMIGHFEISSKYLIQSYIEDQIAIKKSSNEIISKLENDPFLNKNKDRKSGELIGNFVDVVKRNGVIWAGHIHKHNEFIAKGRRFVFIGSPYQQTMGDEGNACGFYILDEQCRDTFMEIMSLPRHIKIKMSDVLSGKFDFSTITGNIVQKIYNVEVPQSEEAKISQKIIDFKPYEEILPDYDVELKQSDLGENKSLELIKKSKLDYIRNYVNNIDQAALDEQKINREHLYKTLENYYNIVSGDRT